ncbi:Ribonuclease H-like domain,Integrase, catalytic core [Cinara cedri]|uniref:Ribonuclease H-like domain,Integrase, catalytic core n=1 Tax=Cinara cedri TaxID=506608 RepID=A0A5E4NEW6_9HEMI|nr:Ribonuclease H-like domain,Integrase, catalytic core [Cinara cedri]
MHEHGAADPAEMRTKFDETVAAILSQKRDDNKAFLSADEYRCRLQQLKRSKIALRTAGQKKSTSDYRLVRRYDVLTVDGRERLVRPRGAADDRQRPLFYVTNDELFDVLHKAHCDIGHGGRNRMIAELKTNYCNVTKESVMTYLKLCARCRGRRKPAAAAAAAVSDDAQRKRPPPPPPRPPFCGSRARIELIDMQARVYDGFRFVMDHRDRATNFVHLVPLKSVRPEEIACSLLDIYATFGMPAALESHCGREYVDLVIEHIRSTCDRPGIVYAEPEYDRSRAEDAHGRIRKMLDAWTLRRNCDNWPLALKFLQLQKNCLVHPATGMSPYQAMFGYPASSDWLSSDFACDNNDDGTDGVEKSVDETLSERRRPIISPVVAV